MNPPPLDLFLQQLSSGEPHAAERLFREYEPFLRQVVRRRLHHKLRTKFDSADIVQSVWADLLVGFRGARWTFTDANQLRTFLIKATYNRFLDRVRRSGPALAHEQPLELTDAVRLPTAAEPRPSEAAQADDIWEKLLALCPPDHHEVLRLRREGLSRVEIAARTGLHEGSVRRILRRLAREFAFAAPADDSLS